MTALVKRISDLELGDFNRDKDKAFLPASVGTEQTYKYPLNKLGCLRKITGTCFKLPHESGTFTVFVHCPSLFHDFMLSFDVSSDSILSFRATGMNPDTVHQSELFFARCQDNRIYLDMSGKETTLLVDMDYDIEASQLPGGKPSQIWTWVKFRRGENSFLESNTFEPGTSTKRYECGVGTRETPSSKFYQEYGTKVAILNNGEIAFADGYKFLMETSVAFTLKKWSTFHMEEAVELRMQRYCNFLMDTYCGFRMQNAGNITIEDYAGLRLQRFGAVIAEDRGLLKASGGGRVEAGSYGSLEASNFANLKVDNYASVLVRDFSHINVGGGNPSQYEGSGLDVSNNSELYMGMASGRNNSPSLRKLLMLERSFLFMGSTYDLEQMKNANCINALLAVTDYAKAEIKNGARLDMMHGASLRMNNVAMLEVLDSANVQFIHNAKIEFSDNAKIEFSGNAKLAGYWDTEGLLYGDTLHVGYGNPAGFNEGFYLPFTRTLLTDDMDISRYVGGTYGEPCIFIGNEYKFLNETDSDAAITYNAYAGRGASVVATKTVPPHRYAKLMLAALDEEGYVVFAEEA